ncbi:MAG: hypothetical protein L3J34_12870 [Flavobacteriaceae bacterium]|nr:hypothetical protein [Flavobacteriaceae bacterium]
MGILNFKSNTANTYIKKQLKLVKNSNNKKVSKIQNVGIVADVNLFRAYDFTKKLSENLGIDASNINVILYDIEKTESLIDNYRRFSDKSFGLQGKIKDTDLSNFVNTSFDLLINYCEETNIYGQVIVCRSKAKLKAGFENEYADFYDLSVNIPENRIDTFNSEIIKYLQILSLLK